MIRYRNQTSVKIAIFLAKVKKPRTVNEIADSIEADHTTVIRALRTMRKHGLVFSIRRRCFDINAHPQELVYYLETPTNGQTL